MTSSFTIPNSFLASLSLCCSAIGSRRSTLPILANVLITERDGGLVFVVTDLESTIECRVQVASQKGTRFTIAIKDFLAMAANAVDMEVAPETACQLRCGSITASLPTLPADEFPSIPTISQKATSIPILANKLARALRTCVKFASVDGARHVINSALLDFTKDGLFVVSTTGRCLSRLLLQSETAESRQIIIPIAAASLLASLLDRSEGDVMICSDDNAMVCRFSVDSAEVTVTSKLVEGLYPNYNQVIPAPPTVTSKTTVNREAMLAAIRAIGFACEDVRGLNPRLKLLVNSGKVRMQTSMDNITKTAEATVECVGLEKPFDIVLNYGEIRDALSSVPDDAVELGYVDDFSAVTISAKDALFVHMPFRKT